MLWKTLYKEHQDCITEANEFKNVLENAEKEGAKFDKDDCLKSIDKSRKKFRNLMAFSC